MIIFHIATEQEWIKHKDLVSHESASLKKEGYIHCCTFEQILHVANNNLKNISENLFVICINTNYLTSEIKWEKNLKNNITFPHVYGPINSKAIINSINLSKNKNGDFFISDELYSYSKYEKSCGGIVVHKFEDNYKVLLIKFMPNKGEVIYGFPKGHIENNETELETARREIKEEVGLNIEFINGFRKNVYYCYSKSFIKEAVYFGAISSSKKVNCQVGEVEDYLWCDFNEVNKHLTYQYDKNIFNKFLTFFKNKNKYLN